MAWLVFQDEKQIVSEVQISFMGVLITQGASAHVKYLTFRHIENLVPLVFDPPAPIDFFHMGKKIGVESAGCHKQTGSDDQSSPAAPENGTGLVILPAVFFGLTEQAPSAKRVSKLINEASGSAAYSKKSG